MQETLDCSSAKPLSEAVQFQLQHAQHCSQCFESVLARQCSTWTREIQAGPSMMSCAAAPSWCPARPCPCAATTPPTLRPSRPRPISTSCPRPAAASLPPPALPPCVAPLPLQAARLPKQPGSSGNSMNRCVVGWRSPSVCRMLQLNPFYCQYLDFDNVQVSRMGVARQAEAERRRHQQQQQQQEAGQARQQEVDLVRIAIALSVIYKEVPCILALHACAKS